MKEHTKYKGQLVERFWAYQQRVFPNEDVFEHPFVPNGRPPVFLTGQAWRNIIIDPERSSDEIARLLALIPKPDRHKWFRSMSSSQALAQSVFGNLAIAGELECLTGLQADEGESLLGNAQLSSDSFAMEYKVSHLGEPRPTSLDGYVSGSYRVAVECKLTETGVGTCSRPRLSPKASNYESEHCSGGYSKQRARIERCSLTEVGVRYWRYVPSLFKWQSDTDLTPCPLNGNYQLVRNILAVGVDVNGKVSREGGHVVLIYDARNPAFQAGGKGLAAYKETRAALCEPAMLRKCSWQKLTMLLRQQGVLPWLMEHLELKYGL